MTLVGQILHVTRWFVTITFIGLLTGIMAVIFPPAFVMVVVGLAGAVLLWVMPELRFVPERPLRTVCFVFAIVQIIVPNYYAIQLPLLPWISVRRIVLFLAIILGSITIAGSSTARRRIADALAGNVWLTFGALGFLVMVFLSIFTAGNPAQATKAFLDDLLQLYLPLLMVLLVMRSPDDVTAFLKLLALTSLIVVGMGVVEFILQRRYYMDFIPKSMLEPMLDENPALADLFTRPLFRNGLYRAASIFVSPLSLAEYCAMIAPIGVLLTLHSDRWSTRILGIVVIPTCLFGIFISGSRGGYISFLLAVGVMFFAWVIRYSRANPRSLAGATLSLCFVVGVASVVGLIAISGRAGKAVIGGGETYASTDARAIQWKLALPIIEANPVTGHGGQSSGMIGYFSPGAAYPSVDSYVITLLVEQGVPGLLLFFGMVCWAVFLCLRKYMLDNSACAVGGGALGSCLLSFIVYRIALSQMENQTLVYSLVGAVFVWSKLVADKARVVPAPPRHAPVGSPRLATQGLYRRSPG